MLNLACGQCTDGALSGSLPFLFYWTLLFLIWGLVWGLAGTILAWRRGAELSMKPLRYLIAAIAAVVVSAPVLMGSVLLPMLLFLPVWLFRLWRRPVLAEDTEHAKAKKLGQWASQVRRSTLSLALLLVPVAYVRLYFQNNPNAYPLEDWLVVPPAVAAAGTLVVVWALTMVWLDRRRAARAEPEPGSANAESDQ